MGTHTALISPGNGSVTTSSGTSFSCPIIAGAAACLWQICPAASAMQIRAAILQSASQYTHPDDSNGYGLPDMVKAARILMDMSPCQKANQYAETLDKVFISVDPNPTPGKLYIIFNATDLSPVTLNFYNLAGQKVSVQDFVPAITGYNHVLAADAGQWAAGMYICELVAQGHTYHRRFVVAPGHQ
jgi:hypothetical protein